MSILIDLEKNRAELRALAGSDGLWSEFIFEGRHFPIILSEFWTSRQRQASSLHEISYRACFKPQLPRFFIERLTSPKDIVYDPFGGRGTTAIEAAMLGRRVISNDVNPLSQMLARPRLHPSTIDEVAKRLSEIPKQCNEQPDLDMFFHPNTEAEIRALRRWFLEREGANSFDGVDGWIRMVATNRLTGHSPGFFSVYTLPPNQAVSREKQAVLNSKRNQSPEYRDTHALILKKTRQLLAGIKAEELANIRVASSSAMFLDCDARATGEIPSGSVSLTVTSPPFLDVVQYHNDNWMRCWFCGLDAHSIGANITMARTRESWAEIMGSVLEELCRIAMPGGHVAFEVGEIKKGRIKLEEIILPLGMRAGLEPLGIIINSQTFSKTANIWGVKNNAEGTNTNRIVLFRKNA
ncbi:MAG: site-specific DNA-methyltransferase [Holophagaceae bacterium]|nr:site-specific DNA-methyltransferase [Holophagaceae bacterium]